MTLISTFATAFVVIPALALAGVAAAVPSPPPPRTASSAVSQAASSSGLPASEPPAPRPTTSGLTDSQPPTSGPPGSQPTASAPTSSQSWIWPFTPIPTVVRGFQVGPSPWSPGHRGVDLAAPPGAGIRAPAAGIVRFAGMLAGRPVLTIDHGEGLVSSFEPAISRLRPGTTVAQGNVVATLAAGINHCSPGSCLHWGVRRDGRYIDPLTLLPASRGPAVLLPLLS